MPEKTLIKATKQKKGKPFIYFSLSKTLATSSDICIFKYVYDKMTTLAKAYDFRVVWRIPVVIANFLSNDYSADSTFARVLWSKTDCLRFRKKAGFAVVDTIEEAMAALRPGKEVLLMYKEDIPAAYKAAMGGVFISNGFEGILKETEKIMMSLSDTDTTGVYPLPLLFDCPSAIEGDKISGNTEDAADINSDDIKILRKKLLLWEQCQMNKEKVLALRNEKKYDELSLIFSDFKDTIGKSSGIEWITCFDDEVISVFREMLDKQGETSIAY